MLNIIMLNIFMVYNHGEFLWFMDLVDVFFDVNTLGQPWDMRRFPAPDAVRPGWPWAPAKGKRCWSTAGRGRRPQTAVMTIGFQWFPSWG